MARWYMPDTGKQAVAVHCVDGKWFANAAHRHHADTFVGRHNADCAAYEARIAELEAELDAARQYAHTMDLQNADYGRLVDELARVKAESVRVVCMPDNGNLYDWYMTPTGLGYPGKDRKQNNCIESAEGYYRLDDCQPVRLERWEDEG